MGVGDQDDVIRVEFEGVPRISEVDSPASPPQEFDRFRGDVFAGGGVDDVLAGSVYNRAVVDVVVLSGEDCRLVQGVVF